MIKRILLIILVVNSALLKGQSINFGYSVGLAFSFGTHVNRLGIHAGGYMNYGQLQLNITSKCYYNFQSYALKNKTPEIQVGIGGVLGVGRKDSIVNAFIGLSESNMYNRGALGYSFLYYWDWQGTSQAAGVVMANFDNLTVLMENDLFGNFVKQEDRYRTGALAIEYQYQRTKIGLNAMFWTHDYKDCNVVRNADTDKWSRYGYYKDDNVKSRNASLGILSVYGKQWLPYNQELRMDIGLNSEKIRNAFQNKLIHDQPMMPEKLVWRKPSHIPMLTTNGEQYLFQKAQVVKPSEFYFNISGNSLSFF